ncbi:putative bifunctional diguanylate cyclase/phosphodiesterase [Kaarinaea lacus]
MSLRPKLILSFVLTSLAVVMIFAVIAYTSAKDYARFSELNHVHESNEHVINKLGVGSPSLEQIEWLLPKNNSDHAFYFIVDKISGEIVSGIRSDSQRNIAGSLIRSIDTTNGSNNGIATLNGENYFWAADPVPETNYILLNTFHHLDTNVGDFIDYIGNTLAITIFTAFWLSLWAATILANLFQRLANQKTEIEHRSRHDPLTSLPNRQTIGEILDASIRSNNNDSENLILCLIDINGLSDVNDTLGHEYGDRLLINVSERLKDILRTSDQVGRFGGDKFATILTHSKNTAIEEVCNRILAIFDRTFQVDGHGLYLGATLGIASYPEHAEEPKSLIQKAEIALHTAKDSSKDFYIYDVNIDQSKDKRLNLANDLRNAIRDGQLELYYQPQQNLRTGKIVSVEALARWNHPEHGFIPPDTFISIAERTGMIKQFTEWVLTTAVKQCSEWRKSFQSLSVSINLSARNLHDETMAKQIARLIRHWKIIPEQICLEITETAMMADPEHARLLLEEMDRLGLKISIDDFGTGYSSLTYLKRLPVDEIKIDRSFVMNMGNSENDASIIRATVGLAHDLGLTVVAEGVEDQESQDQLKQMGCEIAQGYHICKPVPASEISQFIASINGSPSKSTTDDESRQEASDGFDPGQNFKPA